jgi:hypothetical protein
MVAAIIWCAKIRIVRPTFVGFVLVRGNRMAHLGLTVLDMIKIKPKQPGMHRIDHELHLTDI